MPPKPITRAARKIAVWAMTTSSEAVIRAVRRALNEVPDISVDNGEVRAGGNALKGMSLEAVRENMVLIRETRPNGFMAQGFTLVYFMDSAASAQAMGKGELPYLMVPRGEFHSGGNPITAIWKKKYAVPGTEHILGVVEGVTNEDEIFVDMVTVRNGYRRASIASKLMGMLKSHFPKAKLVTSSKTTDGERFFKKTKVEEMTTCSASLAGVPAYVKVPQKPKSWIILGRRRRNKQRSAMYDPSIDRAG